MKKNIIIAILAAIVSIVTGKCIYEAVQANKVAKAVDGIMSSDKHYDVASDIYRKANANLYGANERFNNAFPTIVDAENSMED